MIEGGKGFFGKSAKNKCIKLSCGGFLEAFPPEPLNYSDEANRHMDNLRALRTNKNNQKHVDAGVLTCTDTQIEGFTNKVFNGKTLKYDEVSYLQYRRTYACTEQARKYVKGNELCVGELTSASTPVLKASLFKSSSGSTCSPGCALMPVCYFPACASCLSYAPTRLPRL